MALRALAHTEIDLDRWDTLVEASPEARCYHKSVYLSVVTPEWQALVYGDYEFAMPLPVKRIATHTLVAQPIFTRELGIVGREETPGEVAEEFARHLSKYGDLHLGIPDSQANAFESYSRRRKAYQVLKLDMSIDDLRSGYSTNITRILKKDNRLVVGPAGDVPPLIDFWRDTIFQQIDELGERELAKLDCLVRATASAGSGFGVEARQDGEIVAAAWFVRFRDQVAFIKSGMNDAGRKTGAMSFIFDFVIDRHSGRPGSLDFGGSNIPSIAHFFKKFGAEDRHYTVVEKGGAPAWLKAARAVRSRLRR